MIIWILAGVWMMVCIWSIVCSKSATREGRKAIRYVEESTELLPIPVDSHTLRYDEYCRLMQSERLMGHFDECVARAERWKNRDPLMPVWRLLDRWFGLDKRYGVDDA